MTARGLARAPLVLHEHLSAIAPDEGDDMLLWMVGVTLVLLYVLALAAVFLFVLAEGLFVWSRRRMHVRRVGRTHR